jgi:hypothetical protein
VCKATTYDMWGRNLEGVPFAYFGLASDGPIGFPKNDISCDYCFYWIDVFAKNQHVPSPAMDEFRMALQAPGKMILPMWPSAEPICLNRIWCLYEIWTAMTMNTEIVTIFGDDEIIDALELEGGAKLGAAEPIHYLAKIKSALEFDVRRASATVPDDIDTILGLIDESVGAEEMNESICVTISSFLQKYLARNHELATADLSLPCFDGDSTVLMYDGSTKAVRDMKAGDMVLTYDAESGSGKDGSAAEKSRVAKVVLVTRDKVPGGMSEMCQVSKALFTPEHPIFDTAQKKWRQAKDVVPPVAMPISEVFNIELDEGHSSVVINGVGTITLGSVIEFDVETDALYGWGWKHNPMRRRLHYQQQAF